MQINAARFSRRVLIGLVMLFIGLALITAATFISYTQQRNQLTDAAFVSATLQATQSAASINDAFESVKTIADGIAAQLTNGDLPYSDVQEHLVNLADENPDVDGMAVTFAPYVYDEDLRLYQFYVFYNADGERDTLDGATYDYTQPQQSPDDPNTSWYLNPLENGPTWNEPFFAAGAQKVLVEYGVPFYRVNPETGESEAAGVVTIDYSLADTQQLIARLDLGATGYGMLISSEGTFLASPVTRQIARQTIFDVAAETDTPALSDIGRRALDGEAFNTTFTDPITEHEAWAFAEPITSTNWALIIVLNQSEFLPAATQTLQDQVTLMLLAAATLYVAFLLLMRVHGGSMRSLWTASIGAGVVCAALIGAVWMLTINVRDVEGTPITSQTTADRYLAGARRNVETSAPLVEIPTGIIIESIIFPDAISATVNGYVWQRFPLDVPDNIARGVQFPRHNGPELMLDEVERIEQDGEEVIVWYFGVTLAQDYDPTRFPFDLRDITIELAPADLSGDVLLVPDFTGYGLTNPSILPGVDPAVAINNWTLESSYFSYREGTSITTFGITNRVNRVDKPDLFFSISTARQFVGPFLSYLLPAVVVMMMMFAHLITGREPGDEHEIIETLNYSAALFFVIAVLHASLREAIAAVDLTYFEYFFILLYVAIVSVSTNVFMIAKRPNLFIVRYGDNIIPRLLYWPLFAGTLLFITLLIFVY